MKLGRRQQSEVATWFRILVNFLNYIYIELKATWSYLIS